MESEQLSTIEIVSGDTITEGGKDGKVVARVPVGQNCIELTALRGEPTNTVKLGIRAVPYPCCLCKLRVEGPEKDSIELSKDSISWVGADKYLFFQIITEVNQILYIRSQTYASEEFREYIENYLYLEFKAPIGSSGSGT